jgi:GntR family histidine utilization transcriptional repressor
MPLPDAASPLYERVKGYILGRIGSGEWGADHKLPSENDLVQQLGVSRMTVHRALRELTSAGILVRVQGVGTFVAAARPQSALMEVRDIAEEIRARGHRHSSSVLALEKIRPGRDLVREFEAPGLRTVFRSLIVHKENDEPVQVEERHVNPAMAPAYLEQDFERITPYDYLQRCAPVTEVEHVITAVRPGAGIGPLLGIAPDAPCLLLRRRTWSGSAVVTVNRLWYPGGRYSLGGRYRAGSR